MNDQRDITALLADAGDGDRSAWDRLVNLVYPDLKRLAQRSLRGDGQLTLNTTALVHECYLRLARASGAPRDRGHLMSSAVRIMRQVLIDHARERLALKRGGAAAVISVDDIEVVDDSQFEALIEIDTALRQLAAIEPRQVLDNVSGCLSPSTLRRSLNALCNQTKASSSLHWCRLSKRFHEHRAGSMGVAGRVDRISLHEWPSARAALRRDDRASANCWPIARQLTVPAKYSGRVFIRALAVDALAQRENQATQVFHQLEECRSSA